MKNFSFVFIFTIILTLFVSQTSYADENGTRFERAQIVKTTTRAATASSILYLLYRTSNIWLPVVTGNLSAALPTLLSSSLPGIAATMASSIVAYLKANPDKAMMTLGILTTGVGYGAYGLYNRILSYLMVPNTNIYLRIHALKNEIGENKEIICRNLGENEDLCLKLKELLIKAESNCAVFERYSEAIRNTPENQEAWQKEIEAIEKAYLPLVPSLIKAQVEKEQLINSHQKEEPYSLYNYYISPLLKMIQDAPLTLY